MITAGKQTILILNIKG